MDQYLGPKKGIDKDLDQNIDLLDPDLNKELEEGYLDQDQDQIVDKDLELDIKTCT